MSYTQDDLDAVRQAKVNLATGERRESITIGGDTVSLASVTMADLTKLEYEIYCALNTPIRRTVASHIRGR